MSGSLFSDNDQSGIIVRDRFVRKEIELPDSIAFELIRHALKVKDAQRDIWEKLADDLNSRMPFSRETVRKSVWKTSDAGNDVLKGMLPLHPLAALLLKNISSAFASNQRSMFNFIKNAETADLQAFQWFIDNYSPDNADILTIDFLWSFFYERGTDEYGTGAGRSNLDSIIRTILDTFPLNESRLLADEKRVLKTILMMQAISQKLGDSVDLFLPTDQNLNLAFEGTDLEDNRAINLAKKLVKDGILYFKPLSGGKFQYAAAAVSGDQAQVEIIKKRIVSETKTAALLAGGDLMLALQLSPALRFRYDIRIVSVETFTSIVNKITNEPKSYKIRAVLSFARNDDEQNKIRELIKTAIRDERYRELVFIDSSSSVLGGERFGQWVDCAANEEYWRNKDGKLADEMSRKARAILEGWRTDIANGLFTVYSMYATTGEPYSSAASAMIALANITIRRYPLSFDNAKVSEQMFAQLGLQSGAKCGISQSCGGVFQQSFIVPLMQGAWQIDKYWESAPALPLSKLKLKVNELIEQGFSKDGRIAFSTIFDMLINLGFMPCNLYALITGFLLKEFSTDPYRYSDGETGDKMSVEKLAEIISEYIKHKNTPIPRYREKYIVVQTREQIAFAKFANTVFGVPENISIEQMAARIRLKLKDLGYPIWCFKELGTQVLDAFVDKLSALANPNNIGESVAKTAAALGKMSLDMPTASGMLIGLLTKANAAQAMAKFLESFENGDLLALATEISAKDVLLDVMLQIGSGETLWLWDKETGEEEIRKLITDYRIVAASNRINASVTSLSDCLKEWCNRAKSVKIPCAALITEMPKLKTFFRILQDIFSSGELTYDKRQSFISELELNSNAIMDFFATKTDVFSSVYSFYLTGFSESEIAVLYSKLPMTSFAMEKSECEEKVAQLAEKMREDQDKYQLHRIWEEATSSKTPKDWSRMHRTPVLCLIPLRVQNDFQRIFRAINNSNPEGSEIKFSLEFLHSQPTLLNELLAAENIDAAFIRDIIGRFVAVLPCPDDVRDRLESVVSLEPYDWYGNPAVLREVEKFAQSRYNQGGSAKALVRIENMDDRKAKDYLKRLIIDNMNVGIEIISEGD